MALHYAYDNNIWELTNSNQPQAQYLFGKEFLIAPVVNEGAVEVTVYLPANSGPWIHLVCSTVVCSVVLFL